MLGSLPVPGLPTNLDNSGEELTPLAGVGGWGLFGHFFSRLIVFSIWEMARYGLNYCLKGPLNPNQPSRKV